MPDVIRRRVLDEQFDDLYGEQSSVAVWDGEHFIEPEQVAVCDLTDWVHAVAADMRIAIDPVLGRIAFVDEPAAEVRVRYHYGFSADIGGGTYDRSASVGASEASALRVGIDPCRRFPKGSRDSPRLEKRWPLEVLAVGRAARCDRDRRQQHV